MTSRTPRIAERKAPPPPTASEAAFERALAALAQGPETVDAFVDRLFASASEYAEDRYASIGEATAFHTKVVGVSFEGRQDVLAGLAVGSTLDLVRQPDNPKDPNAIAVRYGALQVGFLRAAIARHLAPHIDAGARYRARVDSLTGGGERHRGVNVHVERDPAAGAPATQHDGSEREAWQGDEDAVREALIGKALPHAAQRAVLERVDRGSNVLAVFGTGRGKSFCFQFPAVVRALARGEKTLIVYPLRSLANDQFAALSEKLDPLGVRTFRANGSIGAAERAELFAALEGGGWDLVLATPEFLEYHRDRFAGVSRPATVVIDEAHHVYESRHRRAYASLGATVASLGPVQTLAFTATAADDAFRAILEALRIEAWVIDPTVRDNLRAIDARGTRDKAGYLRELFERGEKGIVYCNSRNESAKVADVLRRSLGNRVAFYHAGMPSAERHEVERHFRESALQVVVATSAFGEGIDLPDVRHVVLYHINFDFTEFNQQAGRVGRDGGPASIHLLYGQADRHRNEFIIDRDAPTLAMLRELYAGMKRLSSDGELRSSFAEIARTLDLDKANDRTVASAARIFEDEGLVEMLEDDDGARLIRFLPVEGKVDLTRNERFAEGEATREAFARFADLALSAGADALERIVNRPIYPERVDLQR